MSGVLQGAAHQIKTWSIPLVPAPHHVSGGAPFALVMMVAPLFIIAFPTQSLLLV